MTALGQGERYVGHTVYHTEFMSVILKAGDFYAGQCSTAVRDLQGK